MPHVKTTVLATFNRHLIKLDELNDLFYGHATQEDGSVTGPETMTLLKVRFNCPNNACLLQAQGLGLNQQELEMRSILVRVQQVC